MGESDRKGMCTEMKKNLLTVLILALLIVNIALTGVMMFSVMGTNRKTAELVGNIATVLNLELSNGETEEEKAEVPIENSIPYNIEGEMTIPLKSDGAKASYIMFDIAFYMDKKNKGYKKHGETIDEKKTLIQDTITTVVGNHTEAECRDNFDAIKDEILTAVQKLFDSDFIFKVAISNVKYM